MLSRLPKEPLEDIARVLEFGASKYAWGNWQKGISYSRLLDALLRHTYAIAEGEDVDQESGLPHIAHAGACVLFLSWMQKHRSDMDDRVLAPHMIKAALEEAGIKVNPDEPKSTRKG